MCSLTAQSAWRQENEVAPATYLDAEITKERNKILNPTTKDVVRGFIVYDTVGEGAKRKISKRRLDMVNGGISSHSQLMNNPARLQTIKKSYRRAAAIADVSAEADAERKKCKEDQSRKEVERQAKKQRQLDHFAAKKAELMPELVNLMRPYETGRETREQLSSLTRNQLADTLKYYYEAAPMGMATMNKANLIQGMLQGGGSASI